MTSIGMSNGKVVFKDGKVCDGCCGDGGQCDCPSAINIGGNARTIRATFSGTQCELCMTVAPFLSRVSAPGCRYSGFYTFTSCLGQYCQLMIFFELSNFPDCECNGSGDLCDYEIVAWSVVGGNCVADSVELVYPFC